ncbi:MAG: hypothetical protein JWL69_3530 [Phycisphaerales bacterium]|nr:hypothetical protein [Phycisphaerales bacterium]
MTKMKMKTTTTTTTKRIDEVRQSGAESNDTGRADHPPGPLPHLPGAPANTVTQQSIGGPAEEAENQQEAEKVTSINS